MKKARARRIGGLMALAALLFLVAADTIYPGVTLDPSDKLLLVGIVSSLLGVDIVTKRASVIEAAVTAAIEELNNPEGNGNGGEDDDGR